MKAFWSIFLGMLMLALAACGAGPTAEPAAEPTLVPPTQAPTQPPPTAVPADTTLDSPLDMPNPASQFCVEQGYELEMREEAGGTVGYCLFPDGSECEEWAFFRGECAPATAAGDTTFDSPPGLPNPASQYCIEQGGDLEMREEAGGTVGYCVFADGSECEEWAFYRGECAPGSQ
jgi:putative hemolysin